MIKEPSPDLLSLVIPEFITPLLKKLLPEADNLFGLKGNYAGTGGKGLEHQLFVALQSQINKVEIY